jgi:MFS transporter, FHS family, L-fucose permease
LIGAFIAGFSMCLLNTVVNPMLNKLGGEGNKGNQLIQVGGSFNSVMATITPMFVGILIAGSIEKATISQIFPVMYTAMAVFAIAFFVLLIVPIPEPNAATSTEPIGKLMSGALKFRHFILGAIAIFVYVGVEVGVPGTLNLFLTDPIEKGGAGISSTISGFVVGTYWFLMLIGRLTFGIPCHLLIYRFACQSAGTPTKCYGRSLFRICRSTYQRNVSGTGRSVYFHHVGWYL